MKKSRICLLGAALVLLALSLQLHIRIVSYPWPLQSGEGAMLVCSDRIGRHENPYDFASRPASVNVYGILYPLLTAPWAAMDRQATLPIHRTITAIFILLSCALIYAFALALGASRFLAVFVALNFYACQLFFSQPLARPDALGLFLFLGSLGLAVFYPRNRAALLFACFLAVAAFFCKVYFAVAAPMMILWLLVGKRFRDAALCALVCLVLGLSLGLAAGKAWESYYYETLLVPSLQSDYDFAHMLNQLSWIFTHYQAGLAIALVAPLLLKRQIDAHQEGDPSGPSPVLGILVLAVLATLLFILMLGGHIGNFCTYFIQLALPFWLLLTIPLWRGPWREIVLALLLLLNTGLALFDTSALPTEVANVQKSEWEFMEKLIQIYGVDQTLLGSDWTPWLVAHGRRPYDDGHATYFGLLAKPVEPWVKWIFPRLPQASELYKNYLDSQRLDIERKKFRLIIGSDMEFDREAIKSNYDLQAKMPISFYRLGLETQEVWTPRQCLGCSSTWVHPR